MIGDRIEVLDKLYLAKVSLVPKTMSSREILEYFLVKPVIKSSIFGKRELIGYNEAVTGIRVCNVKYVPWRCGDMDGMEPILVDAISNTHRPGDVDWDVDREKTASEICTEGNIERYFKFADFDIEGRINNIREQSRLQKEEIKVDIFKTRTRSKSE